MWWGEADTDTPTQGLRTHAQVCVGPGLSGRAPDWGPEDRGHTSRGPGMGGCELLREAGQEMGSTGEGEHDR